MTHGQASQLADDVRQAAGCAAVKVVEKDGYHVVQVVTQLSGMCTLRDEQDWRWLRPQIRS